MGPSSEANPPSKQSSLKSSILADAPMTQPETTINVKKEELEDEIFDAAVTIFDDVDDESTDEGSELVDVDHVGFIEHNGINCWVCPGFRIPQIPQVSVVKRPLKDLCDAIKSSDIVLDPEYQRDIVWDDTRCEGLLVSLLMGYLPPPIIFNVKLQITETPNGKLKKYIRTCVDGKQRLTSILRFLRGEIGFLDSKHKKWYYEQPTQNGKKTNSTPNILPTEMKDFFMSRFFICYEYNELSQSTEEEMFQLVQRGIALTPAEKLRAMSTEWATFARKYEDDYSLILNLSKQGRASGFRLILTIFAMVQEIMSSRRRGTLVPTLQASPQALTRMLEEKEPINPALKLNLKAIFDRYESLVKLSSARITTTRYRVNANSAFDTAPNFLRGDGFDHVRTFSPLELISAALLICYHMHIRTDTQLLNDVKEMRRHLRVKHKDLRVNAQCWTSAWEFIVGINSDNTSLEGIEADDLDDAQNNLLVPIPTSSSSAKKAKGTVIKLFRSSSGEKIRHKNGDSRNKVRKNAGNNYSGESPVSALGQSGAGLDTTEGSNGTGEAMAASHDQMDTSIHSDVAYSRRRSARSSVMASVESAATTVGMSSRVTTGRNKSAAKNGKRNGKVSRRASNMDNQATNKSDSSDSLSSVPSSALNSPDPEEIFEHSHKRGLVVDDSGGKASRDTKKSKY